MDGTFVINLKERTDRLHHIHNHFGAFGVGYKLWEASFNEQGEVGLKETFKNIFKKCLKERISPLVFEDDAFFLVHNFNDEYKKVMLDVPDCYHIVKFGANLLSPVNKITENVNLIKMSYALHACKYSIKGMELILEVIDKSDEPIDVIIAKFIEPLGHCYVSSKMLVNQKPYKSSIFRFDPVKHSNFKYYQPENGVIRWDLLMNEMWERNTKHLKNTD